MFTQERALYLASFGPNYTNLADCILDTMKPDFAPLITSGALNGVREVKYGQQWLSTWIIFSFNQIIDVNYEILIDYFRALTESGKFDANRRKSYGGTYLRRPVETVMSESQIDWDAVMYATNSHLSELQDNLLLSYEAQNPNIVHLYPQAMANSAGKRCVNYIYLFVTMLFNYMLTVYIS